MLNLLLIVGARPNFMKVAPLVDAVRARADEFASVLVHTGQHYDAEMSDAFFRDLNLPLPDCHLEVGSGSHARQTAEVMLRFEPVLLARQPNWVVVVGDVNSTLACALVAAKCHVPVAHVEAGLRSRDRTMPEEINRILTDQMSDLLLTPSKDASENLLREGIPQERICFVGNIMIDALHAGLERAMQSSIREQLKLSEKSYGVVTLHRPSNTDDPTVLAGILSALEDISRRLPLVFPVHPRTQHALDELRGTHNPATNANLRFMPPLGYLDFLKLMSAARLVLTDSGGLQEETTALRIPCLTLRENTERPITVTHGTNRVVGVDPTRIVRASHEVLDADDTQSDSLHPLTHLPPPPLWDGRTADRILDALKEQSRALSLACITQHVGDFKSQIRDDSNDAVGTNDFDELEESDDGMWNREPGAEGAQTIDEAVSWSSDESSPELAAQFRCRVATYEQSPWTTHFHLLEEAGINLPSPASIDDERLTAKLWQVIDGLAQMRVFLSQTDHLDDRELYTLLWSEALREPTKDMPRVATAAWHLDLLGSGGDEDNHLYLKYYADEQTRQRWAADFPADALPDQETPPFDRDRHLPQATDANLIDGEDGKPM